MMKHCNRLPSLAMVLTLLSTFAGTARAQPSLASLWPNADGVRWNFDVAIEQTNGPGGNLTGFMQFAGTVMTPGGEAQILVASHETPTGSLSPVASTGWLRSLWQARPDLRDAIEKRYGTLSSTDVWWPLLLHGGSFMKTASRIENWQPDWDHPTWTFLTDDLSVGAQFTHQLIPELADNVFLYGTVEAIDASIGTSAGTFEHAVRVGYLIDYGSSEVVDPQGNVIGTARAETRGHVHYVPDVGPVEMSEDFIPYVEVDCGAEPCPQEWRDQLGLSLQNIVLSLRSTTVAVTAENWSRIKELYQ